MSSISSDLSYRLQLDPKTVKVLGSFERRRRFLLILRGIAAAAVFFLIAMGLIAFFDYLWLLSDATRWGLSIAGYVVTALAGWWFGIRPMGDGNVREIARQVEATDPRLREDLLSAVELADPASANGSSGFRVWLQERVASRAADVQVSRLLPVELIQRWLVAGLLFAAVFAALLLVPRMQFARRIARAMLPGVPIERASLTEIMILEPSPPSGYVAEGDAVAVLVQIGGRGADDVIMQWRNADGVEGETRMTPRVAPSSQSLGGTAATSDVFAANVSVGTTAVQYRVVAGDAITLWHELTPLPRPRVESFTKRLQFPSYSRLPDRVEETEHGDLKALVGTKAFVTIRFDEPVDAASIRFGNRGTDIKLEPVEGTDHEFLATIPIRTPGSYQVDAISSRSGLNNPFSPQYSITPIVDSPPVAQWSEETPRLMIVSPLDVVPLTARVFDDLPIDHVIQEFQINGEPALARNLSIDESSRDMDLNWGWDLLHRMNDEESIKLASGDIIRTRIVAVDRNSQRGESSLIEILIADEGFDTDRHARMNEIKEMVDQIAAWAAQTRQWMTSASELSGGNPDVALAQLIEEATMSREESEVILGRVEQVCRSSSTLPEAGEIELLGRALSVLAHDQSQWLAEFQQATEQDQEAWRQRREQILRDQSQQAKQFANQAERLEQYARHVYGETLTTGVIADAMSLRRSLQPMLADEPRMPIGRFPRYLVVTIGRLKMIDQLIEDNGESIPDSAAGHFQNWNRWSDSWRARLQAAVESPPREDSLRALVEQFDIELDNQISNSLIDGRMTSTIQSLLRELRSQVGPSSDLVRQIARHGQAIEKQDQLEASQIDSKTAARANLDRQFAQSSFVRGRDRLLGRLSREESLHRSRPSVNLRFAADMNLMRRAIENVTQGGYEPYREEPAASVYQNLATAYQIIEAKHEADQWLAELRQLMLAERRLDETAIAKVKHPSWLERFASGLEWPVRTLQNAGIEWKELETIDRARSNERFDQARNRITSRRWSGDPMLAADAALDDVRKELGEALEQLDPRVIEARKTIERYVLSLSEQATQAAEETREAEQRTESRPDSQASTARQLDEQQEQAEQAVRETLELLVDLANTSSLIDPEERELARDADIAAARIQQVAGEAEEAMDKATQSDNDQQRSDALDQTAEALEELTEILETTAEHFKNAEQGEDLADTREQIRQQASSLQDPGQLQERYDRAEAMADAAQSSPEEMMRKLEERLQENEPMREELSDIARRAVQEAQRSLEQAARDERAVNQSLERSDASFQERKRRASRQIASLARLSTAVDQSLLQATERAIGWANMDEAKPALDRAREAVREAVNTANKMGGEQALLSEMQQAAGQMADAIDAANQTLRELAKQGEEAQRQDVHKDESSRRRTQSQIDRFARDARSRQLRAAGTEQQQWAREQQQAGRRVQDAQREQSNAQKQKQQLESRLEEQPENVELLRAELTRTQNQIDRASEAEAAARISKEFAEKQSTEAKARQDKIQRKRIEPFEMPNPAGELSLRMSEEAQQELSQIRESLQDLADEMGFADQLRSPIEQAERLANEQQQIEASVNEAAETLRRAARHEQRLGSNQVSEQLNEAALAVSENAAAAASRASESLEQAGSDAEVAPRANQEVARAADEIQRAAESVAELLAASMPQPPSGEMSQASQPSSSQQQGQQLAQTLDELDRQIASSQQQSSESGGQPQSEASQPEASQSGASQSQSVTAQEASPTLANAVDAQSQRAARQRQQQLDPSQEQPGQGDPTNQSASQSAGTDPGLGEMPAGGFLDPSEIERTGSEWGQLRERRTDDVAEGPGSTIAPQYRREIEAYFRAIARQASQRQE